MYVHKGNNRPDNYDENLGGFMDVTFAIDKDVKKIDVVAKVNNKSYKLVGMTGQDFKAGDKVYHIGFQIKAFEGQNENLREFFTDLQKYGGEVQINVEDKEGNSLEEVYTMNIENFPEAKHDYVPK